MTVYDTRKIFPFGNHNRHVVTALQFLALTIYDLHVLPLKPSSLQHKFLLQ
uniref:Uncharacterized protein n=1 Tax=Arundo donax TaxID=35708 RepID=A0A0A9GCI4_ARUDO